MVEASAIVPSYNGRDLLEQCLPSICAAMTEECRGEVIVADDGSTDDTREWLSAAWHTVRVVALPENRGFAAAVNAAARAARAPHLLITNNDVEVRPGWARRLLDCLRDHPEAAVAGGLALDRGDPDIVSSAGIRIARSASAADIGMGRPVSSVRPVDAEVTAVSGVSMAVRREWFLEAGGFDELLGMYYEDVDLCLRAWREGYTVRHVPDAVLLHGFGGTTGGRESERRSYYRARNRLVMAYKTLDLRGVGDAIVLGGLHDLAGIGALAVAGDATAARRTAAAGARGWLSGFGALARARAGRRRVRARAVRSASDLRRLGRFDPLARSIGEYRRMRRS